MTPKEITEFRSKFKSLVYSKGLITEQSSKISNLYRWDKNGSHSEAIKKAEDRLIGLKKVYKEKLESKTYEQWKMFSKQISLIHSEGKSIESRLEKHLKKLEDLKF